MQRIVSTVAALFAAIALCWSAPAQAATLPQTFAKSIVTAKIPRGAEGVDAGIDVSGGRYVRITASGAIAMPYAGCGHSVGPDGCASAYSFSRVATSAPTGSLIVAFTSRSGALVSSWSRVGTGAYVSIPQGASRMLLRVNGATARDGGSYTVVADVVNGTSALQSAGMSSGAVRRPLSTARRVAAGYQLTRADVQYLLRRFAFSDTPANVTAVYTGGVTNWLSAQLQPATIDDSALTKYMNAIPMITGNSMNPIDQNYGQILEYRLNQREVASKRQLLEKVTLHWLEHFAVSEDKVNDPGAMAHFEDTVRADALGNFQTLISDISVEPAMLRWLDNNGNVGSSSTNPPNENFARELMQLYTLGINKLNMDGTPVMANGQPVPSYGEPDVKAAAVALCGFYTYVPYPQPVGDPRLADVETFRKSTHGAGPYQLLGTTVADPGDATVVDNIVKVIAHNPTTAPFEAKELLQRFVSDTPSAGYVTRIATVWQQNVDDPNQIAKVIQAIATDPEFLASRGTTVKEPVEFMTDAVRALNGAAANPVASSFYTLSNVDGSEGYMGQGLWYPPTVFSFYRPGDKESLMTNSELLARYAVASGLAGDIQTKGYCTNCNTQMDFSTLASASPSDKGKYLLDALVDGGTPELNALVMNYMAGSNNVQGAAWMVLSSPEYEVN